MSDSRVATATAPVAVPAPRRLSLEAKDSLLGIALIVPSALFFIILIAYPLVQAILLSLYQIYTPTLSGPYVGVGNYTRLFAEHEFWVSLRNNFAWTFATLTLQVVIGVAMAMMLH